MPRTHTGVRVAIGFAALSLVAACSKPPSLNAGKPTATTSPEVAAPVGATQDTTATTAAAQQQQQVAASVAQQAKATATTVARRALTGGQQLSGGGDDSQARAVGAQLHPQSTQRRQPYYLGVGEDTIQLDFAYDQTSCGVNVVNAITAAGGALPSPTRFYRAAPNNQDAVVADTKESVDLMVKYWNDHAFDAAEYAPEIRKLMGNDPKNQFYGRHLTYKLIDGGSNQCPEKTTAAAHSAAQTDKAFVVYNNLDGASPAGAYNMAAALNNEPADRRPMHFGTLWLSDQDYTRFAPFAWTQFATGSTITREWASYVCSRLVGQNAKYSPDANVQGQKRVFGLVHTNLLQDKRLANEFKSYLTQYCGGTNPIKTEVEYDGTDFAQAQQNNTNLITQLKLSGVTSVLMLTEPVQPLFQLQAAKGQNYYPEWIFSSFGYSDSSTVQRLYDQKETAGSFGTSNLGVPGGFGFGAGDPFYMYHAYHQVAPDGKPCDPSSDEGMNHGGNGHDAIANYCKAPTALVTWYYTMLPSIGGITFAGPDLTPQNVTAGLQAFPPTRYGGNGPTSDPRPALVGAGKGRFGFVVDAVEWRWRPEFKSPPPESKQEGWVEYPDCQRHFLLWPSQLAPNWETNGPNYNAWCGLDKDPYGTPAPGYPRTLPEDGQH